MKFKSTFAIAMAAMLIPGLNKLLAQSASDVFISEYVEGSSNNKALEFYNGTGAPVNLGSGNYVIQMFFNGNAVAGLTIPLTGTIAANDVFVLTTSQAAFITANGGFFTPDQTSSASWFNGDDAIVLKKGGASGTVVDAIGQIGFDPGSEYGTGLISTADNTLRRIVSDCTGDINTSDAFVPSAKWEGFATDDFSGLGSHTSSCTSSQAKIVVTPASLNFITTPGGVSAEQSYTVKGNGVTGDITISTSTPSGFAVSTVSGGPYTASLSLPQAAVNAAPVTVYVIYTNGSSVIENGFILHQSSADTATLRLSGSVAAASLTPIYQIQGANASSSLAGTTVTTEGIVTADFQGAGQLNGFYIQDSTGDGDTLTSDGIFVFNTAFAVSVGDKVRVTATVDEFNNLTELKDLTSLTVLSSANTLPTPAPVSLPLSVNTTLERFEGMLVSFPQTLTVTETFTLARFGEVSLSAGGRLFNPTNFIDLNDDPASGTTSTGTSNVAAVTAQQDLNNRRRILLDDGSSIQNPAVVPYLNPLDTTLRSGSTLAGLTGVVDFAFGSYRIQPVIAPSFSYAPRPAVPSVGEANVKVASFNVLNYFNGNGAGGGFPTSRGANTLVEFNRQRAKIISAIKALNADIVGLIEIENDGSGSNSAIADLVNGLNAATAPGTYALIADPTGVNGNTGTDEIKQAIIYKPSAVTPSGLAKADMDPAHNRPPIAQAFISNASGEKFSVVVTHFKSKSCTGASGLNTDQGDGQGCFNQSRKLQSIAFLVFMETVKDYSGDADIIAVGDYNAYGEEDPLDILVNGGLIKL
ncbi:MAG: ExeM/NucH family extracellular endonuclease, partial [Chitinophagaceae bacterium]|nr:ExeM/NucH family extracellular endonuclease [Chitinophagaceae bacterium]